MRLYSPITAGLVLVALGIVVAPARAIGHEDTAADYRLGNQALQGLLASPSGQTLPRLAWKVQIVESWQVNASSDGRGQIFITRGLAWILGDHLGVWAAAIAHELGHSVMLYPASQPQFEAELRQAYQSAGGDPADSSARAALRVTPTGQGLLNLKGDRSTEYEADRLAMLLMADAGFHPDFAIALDRLMRSALGDQTQFSEFLLSHPLWSNREQRTVQVEGVALAIFQHRWPNALQSPGGLPPPIGRIDAVTVNHDGQPGMLVLHVAFEIRNASGRQVRVAAVLLDRNRKVKTSRAEYQAPDGSLALNANLPAIDHGPAEATLAIPVDAIEARGRKLQAAIFLVAGDWTDDLWFQPVEFPPKS